MDLEWSATDLAFRDEVRTFLEDKLTPELRRARRLMTSVYADHDASMKWQRILHDKGWAAPSWPVVRLEPDPALRLQPGIDAGRRAVVVTDGHQDGRPRDRQVRHRRAEELFPAADPDRRGVLLPGLLRTGSGFGSRGASMGARDDGDQLICTGSKIWTTHAQEANWMFALVRTTRTDKKQRGITFVLIEMSSPGIEIRPLVMTSGEEVQNQVFFDEVRVPKANVIGDIDDGWTVAKYLLEFERGGGASAPYCR